MYDVHPEAAYPLAVFIWAWAAGWGDHKLRPGALLLSTLFLMGIKADSFLVLPPLILATAYFQPGVSKKWLAASSALAAAVIAAHFLAVHGWTSGDWGPHQWNGAQVVIPHGAELMGKRHWDTPQGAAAILAQIVSEKGGALGVPLGFFRFLFSRPWLSLLIIAPWVVLQSAFWISVLPIVSVYSLLDDPGKFINYYSAPVLGLFWLAAIGLRSPKPGALLWLLCASLVLGGSGLDFYAPSDLIERTRTEVHEMTLCLPAQGTGIVSSRFLGLIDPDRVASDRLSEAPLEAVNFYLFSTQLPSFELPPSAAENLLTRLKQNSRWIQLGRNCQPIGAGETPDVLFFRKN